jgi:hypothetical protein
LAVQFNNQSFAGFLVSAICAGANLTSTVRSIYFRENLAQRNSISHKKNIVPYPALRWAGVVQSQPRFDFGPTAPGNSTSGGAFIATPAQPREPEETASGCVDGRGALCRVLDWTPLCKAEAPRPHRYATPATLRVAMGAGSSAYHANRRAKKQDVRLLSSFERLKFDPLKAPPPCPPRSPCQMDRFISNAVRQNGTRSWKNG